MIKIQTCNICKTQINNKHALPFGLCPKCLHRIGIWNKNSQNRRRVPHDKPYMYTRYDFGEKKKIATCVVCEKDILYGQWYARKDNKMYHDTCYEIPKWLQREHPEELKECLNFANISKCPKYTQKQCHLRNECSYASMCLGCPEAFNRPRCDGAFPGCPFNMNYY